MNEAPSELDVDPVGKEAETETVEPTETNVEFEWMLEIVAVVVAVEVGDGTIESTIHGGPEKLPLIKHDTCEMVEERGSVVDESASTAEKYVNKRQRATFSRVEASPIARSVEWLAQGPQVLNLSHFKEGRL